jgi:hypothetical protein
LVFTRNVVLCAVINILVCVNLVVAPLFTYSQRLKVTAHETTSRVKTQKMLELMAQPQQWQMSDGEVAQVQTPATIRAKELLDLFNALNAPLTNTNER